MHSVSPGRFFFLLFYVLKPPSKIICCLTLVQIYLGILNYIWQPWEEDPSAITASPPKASALSLQWEEDRGFLAKWNRHKGDRGCKRRVTASD